MDTGLQEQTGILCKEIYPLKIEEKKPSVDFDNRKVTIYNSDYDLEREGLLTTVIGYSTTDVLKEFPVYKEETLNNIALKPNVNVNVIIDRGDATALEKHYKLTECNTLEDLENYGNNIFNL